MTTPGEDGWRISDGRVQKVTALESQTVYAVPPARHNTQLVSLEDFTTRPSAARAPGKRLNPVAPESPGDSRAKAVE